LQALAVALGARAHHTVDGGEHRYGLLGLWTAEQLTSLLEAFIDTFMTCPRCHGRQRFSVGCLSCISLIII